MAPGPAVTAIGLALPQLGPHVTPEVVRAFSTRAEELGYASVWVQDHFAHPLAPEGGYAGMEGVGVPAAYRQSLTPLELLGAVAAWTTQVRIGTSVLVAGHHRPAPLAKQLATLDVLSRGRLTVGLGVGWCHEEHVMCDVDPRTRGARMDDFVPALLACWGPGPVRHQGPFFDIPPCELLPRPLQEPHPPLLSGMWSAAGRRRTVAHFDGWNPAGSSMAKVVRAARELAALRPPTRPPLTIHPRVFVAAPDPPGVRQVVLGVEGVIRQVEEAVAAGLDEVILDATFWREVRSPEDWVAVPDRLLPALRAADRAR